MDSILLSFLIFLPLVGATALFVLPARYHTHLRSIAFGIAGVEFLLSLLLFCYFDADSHLFQLVQKVDWIKSLGAAYLVGVDGISFWLILLTTFMTPLVILASSIKKHERLYYASFLLLETAMVGTFVSLDLLLFYVFWEMMLIPMYFIIGIWGGARRLYATMKFVLYTLAGGLLMLLGIVFLVYLHYEQFGFLSTSLLDIYGVTLPFDFSFWNIQMALFAVFAIAFLIKVPMFPFHTWLPDAHVEAPTGGSVILAGVLLKMGTYGFIRFAIPLFPLAFQYARPILFPLCIIGIIYGAFLALAQTDIKKLIAYSSVSHMGLIMLGLFSMNAEGVTGSVFQMLCHGISTGALFLMVGMIYERRHTRNLSDFGGLAKTVPLFSVFLMLFVLSSIALPTTNGFVGEFLILVGAFQFNHWFGVLGGLTVILGAYYMLRMIEKVLWGPVTHKENEGLADLSRREIGILIPLVILVFWMGLYPKPFFSKMEKSTDYFIEHYKDYTNGVYEK